MSRSLVTLLVIIGGLGLRAPLAKADPPAASCEEGDPKKMPPELRIQLWARYLQDNPGSPYRQAALAEIDAALAELRSQQRCVEERYGVGDATIDPFEKGLVDPSSRGPLGPSRGKKGLRSAPSRGDLGDATLNPFDPPRRARPSGELVDPFQKPAAPFSRESTLDPFDGAPSFGSRSKKGR